MPIVYEIRGQNNYFHSQSLSAYSKDVRSTEMSRVGFIESRTAFKIVAASKAARIEKRTE